jgi:hypothetical protein
MEQQSSLRFTTSFTMPSQLQLAIIFIFVSAFAAVEKADAQGFGNDTRQEYVRSSSPTKSGARVINENVAGRKMVRIARVPGSTAPRPEPKEASSDSANSQTSQKYSYPERDESAQVTAYRQAANLPPTLNFPANNRLAQCNCNGVPTPAAQLQFPPQQFQTPPVGYGYTGYQAQPNFGFQAPGGFQPQQNFGTGFQPQQNFGAAQSGYPLQAGIGVPQFNQTGGNWWTPFLTGSGYYTPLLNFRNMPQGTYLGQGVIGQPTAYVDGQPFRNLLRYVSP